MHSTSHSIFTLLLLLLILGVSPQPSASQTDELVFLNWSDYIDPDLVRKFESEYGVKLRQPYFESDDHRSDLLLETKTVGYDLAITDTPGLHLYRRLGWLAPIEREKIPSFLHIDPRWLDSAGADAIYSVPYFWGTLGIAYRRDLVEEPPRRWMDLFRPDESLSGAIGLYRNTIDLVGALLKALGYSINDTDLDHLDEAASLLREVRPHVKTWDYLSLGEDSLLVKGEIKASMFYNSDALMVAEHNEQIDFLIPEEGCAIWVDHLVVFHTSDHKDLAWKFIDFLNRPENAAQLARHVWGATPNRAARALLPKEFLEDSIVFPDEERLARCEFNRPLPPRVVKKRARITSELTR
jgi:spermidine/putrescine transport system substrate-binding protein